MRITFYSFLLILGFSGPSLGFLGDKSWPRNFEGHSCTNDSASTERPSLMRSNRQLNCPAETNLICSSRGICECPSADLVYVHDNLSCLPVATKENNYSCVSAQQCRAGSFGRYSTCNFGTSSCECHGWPDTSKDPSPTEVELIDGVCYVIRSDVEGRLKTQAAGLFASGMELGAACGRNEECVNSLLGSLSRCNMVEKRCECYDTKTGGKNAVGLYEGVCWVKRTLGDFCEANEECRFGWHKNAVCVAGDSYLPTQAKICTCPSESQGGCDGQVGGGGSGVTINIGVVLISSAMLKIMTVFV